MSERNHRQPSLDPLIEGYLDYLSIYRRKSEIDRILFADQRIEECSNNQNHDRNNNPNYHLIIPMVLVP